MIKNVESIISSQFEALRNEWCKKSVMAASENKGSMASVVYLLCAETLGKILAYDQPWCLVAETKSLRLKWLNLAVLDGNSNGDDLNVRGQVYFHCAEDIKKTNEKLVEIFRSGQDEKIYYAPVLITKDALTFEAADRAGEGGKDVL